MDPYDFGQTRSFNLGIAKLTSIEAALLFDEISFWYGKRQKGKDWIYKSYDELKERLPLSSYQIRESIKKLVSVGMIETKLMKATGVPTVHSRFLKNLTMESEKTLQSINSNYLTSINIDQKQEAKPKLDDKAARKINVVYRHYLNVFGLSESRFRLTDKRKKQLNARLKDFSVSDLNKAITNAYRHDFYSGRDGKWSGFSLEWMTKNIKTVEKMLNLKVEETEDEQLDRIRRNAGYYDDEENDDQGAEG